MVGITIDLVRKRAEHHDRELAPLKEIALHQEAIERIEFIQSWCPRLQILLLQSNLIAKIENLSRLKELEYLNLAINNIEKIENLEKCESLNKLDLTLNFIGELTSVESLRDNYNLKILYLVGNPCSDYAGYREYVIGVLPQLNFLDNEEISRTERIIATQKLDSLRIRIIEQQNEYAVKREGQRIRMKKYFEEKSTNYDPTLDDEEENKRFWNEKSEHCPEMRVEIETRRIKKEKLKENTDVQVEKRKRTFFAPDGRPYNINEAKIKFTLNDDNPNQYELELHLYKHLDTSLIEADIQPTYVRATIKNKVFQISIPEEICIEKSSVQRSSTTGHLKFILQKMELHVKSNEEIPKLSKINNDNTYNRSKREYLEIGPSNDVLDFTKMTTKPNYTSDKNTLRFPKEKSPSLGFVDDPQVPPLI